MTTEMVEEATAETGDNALASGFTLFEGCEIKGVEEKLPVWGLPAQTNLQ
jgi:hypothetical protein